MKKALGGDLFQARVQYMDVNARWSMSSNKVCQMYDLGEDKMAEHVMLKCEKYDRDRIDMMQVILPELGCNMNEMGGKKTWKEWMVFAARTVKRDN